MLRLSYSPNIGKCLENLNKFGTEHKRAWFWIQTVNSKISELRLLAYKLDFRKSSTLATMAEESANALEYSLDNVLGKLE